MIFDFFEEKTPARLYKVEECPVLDIHSLIYGSMTIAALFFFIFLNMGGL